ncbi:MAG: DNA primase [Chitinophagales bacterium]|nr:DNA primase [Chitinophagales bacterium]
MISKETIAKINDEADIIDVLSDFILLKKAGTNYKANCPFHHEKTPSFVISPAKQIYKCFGCGKAGDSVKFVMEHEHFSYVEALKYLAQKYNIEVEETEQSQEEILQQSFKDGLYILNEFAKDFYQNQLFETEMGKAIGLSYFKERGFSEQTIKNFQLGYAPAEAATLTQAALDKGYLLDMLQNAGLSSKKENTKLDFFRERVMFPIQGVSGKVLGFGGRILKSNAKAPKYINTPDTEIYDKSKVLYGMFQSKIGIRKQDECILVEGYTDVISLHQAGIQNVVSSSGTSLTPNQVKLIKRYTENVCVLYDGDSAGIKAALRGIDIILENGLNVKVALLPENHDPDSFVQEKGMQGFEDYLKQHKKDFILFKLELLIEDAGTDPVKKAALVNDIIESISKIPDAIKRSVYIKETAALLELSEQVLLNESNKTRKEYLKLKNRENNRQQEETLEENIEIKTELLDKDKEYIEAGILIENFERAVIRTLIEYGSKPYNEEKNTAEYIIEQINDIPFDNDLHNKIISISKEIKKEVNENYYVNHEDEEISNLAITLIFEKYSLSDNWLSKHKIHTPTKQETFKEDIETEIYWLKFWRLKMLEQEVMKRMQKEWTEEEFKKLLLMKKRLDEKRKTLSADKGTVYTPK